MNQTNKMLLLAGGIIGLGWYLSKSSGQASPFGNLFSTMMPQSATEAQRASWFGATAGKGPSQMSVNGTGNTSVVPATVNAIAALGRSILELAYRPPTANTASPQVRAQASMGSGGGVEQPYGPSLAQLGATYEVSGEGLFWRDPITNDVVAVPQTNVAGNSNIIFSDQGGYDVLTGQFFPVETDNYYDEYYQ